MPLLQGLYPRPGRVRRKAENTLSNRCAKPPRSVFLCEYITVTPICFLERLLCIAVEAGLEKRRYLLFASLCEAKSLVSAAFFTERERPAETVMHKRRIVFSMA